MSWSTFGISAGDIGDRLSYAVTMALTIVAFQFIISERLPQVNYMTLLDKYNLYIFSLVLFVTVESTIVGYNGEGLIPHGQDIDEICGYIFLVFFIVGNIFFVIYARYVNKVENAKIGQWPDFEQDILRSYNTKPIHQVILKKKEDSTKMDDSEEYHRVKSMGDDDD